MQELHIISADPTPNVKKISTLEPKIEAAYAELSKYLETLKTKKDEVSFKEHEAVITRMVYSLGQAALFDALSHYDMSGAIIEVEEQTYRLKHLAPKTYQTSLGPVTLERHVYVNRKKGGDGRSICPLELQTGMIESYWTPMAAKHAMWALSHLTPQEVEEMLLQFGKMNPSRSSLDRLPKILNQYWEPQTIAHHESLIVDERIPTEAVSFSVSLDGVMVGMKPEQTADNTSKKNRMA